MKFNADHIRNSVRIQSNSQNLDSTNVKEYGRVIEVLYDPSHPKLKPDAGLGGAEALYGLFYQPLFQAAEDDLGKMEHSYARFFAYCGSQTLRQIPVKGEIVKLNIKLSAPESEESFKSDGSVYKVFWTEIVPLYNHPHLNAYPDIPNQSKNDFGPEFKENENIKPLQLNPGDVTLEGRHGQSLRFGGTSSDLSPIAESESNGKPYTILRNGQGVVGKDTCLEDIDKDDSSIYLTSDHKVPVTEANRKFAGARKVQDLTQDYRGKQIVANSDRIVVNAREDRLVLAAKGHASVNAQSVSIDGIDYVGLDASKVYLGEQGKSEIEPVLKGQTSVDFLKSMYDILYLFFNMQGAALGSGGSTAWEKAASTAFTLTATQLKALFSGIDSLKSGKVYTE